MRSAPVHRIVAIRRLYSPGCERCSDATPHNVVARCACGETAAGKGDHIWTITGRDGDLVTLAPSFGWWNDPSDPAKGEHLHEFVTRIPDETGKAFVRRARPGTSK